MRTIRISDEVWSEIAKVGKFGETEDDVLCRVFNLEGHESRQEHGFSVSKLARHRGHYATNRMHAGVHDNHLLVSFANGAREQWELPNRTDKGEIRRIREEAVKFALANGASQPGQTNAVLKALTDAGYYLNK